ncbi:MAG: TolC family protein [Chitinophagales bacterium]
MNKWLLLFYCVFMSAGARAAGDTLRLDLKGCERLFLDNNLELLLAKTDIDVAKGLLLQSKLFDNPEVDLNRQLYSINRKEFLSHNPNTQFDVQVTQLISTAGKHWKEVAINKDRVKLSELEYYNVLRGLRYELRESFFQLVDGQRKYAVFQDGITALERLIAVVNYQVEKGNVARKELIRLNSQLLSLQNDQRNIADQCIQNQSNLKSMLGLSGNEVIIASEPADEVNRNIKALVLDSLEQVAFANRQDVLEARLQTEIGQKEVQLAKMNGAPDLRLGVDYDRYGSSENNYTGLVVSVPLPVFNHNQGNIKIAKAENQKRQYELQLKEIEVHNSLVREYTRLLNAQQMYERAKKQLGNGADEIYKGIYDSYQSRTIGLIEFLEYFDAYRNTRFNLIDIETSLRLQVQRLNFELGKDIL